MRQTIATLLAAILLGLAQGAGSWIGVTLYRRPGSPTFGLSILILAVSLTAICMGRELERTQLSSRKQWGATGLVIAFSLGMFHYMGGAIDVSVAASIMVATLGWVVIVKFISALEQAPAQW